MCAFGSNSQKKFKLVWRNLLERPQSLRLQFSKNSEQNADNNEDCEGQSGGLIANKGGFIGSGTTGHLYYAVTEKLCIT